MLTLNEEGSIVLQVMVVFDVENFNLWSVCFAIIMILSDVIDRVCSSQYLFRKLWQHCILDIHVLKPLERDSV